MIKGLPELYHIRETNPKKALEIACREFESIFAHQLLKTMGESMPDGLSGPGLASDIYKDMLFLSIAQSVAESGALGIGKTLQNHIQNIRAEVANQAELSITDKAVMGAIPYKINSEEKGGSD